MWLSVNNAFLSKDHVTQSSNRSWSSRCFSETTCSTRSCQLAFVLFGLNFMLWGKKLLSFGGSNCTASHHIGRQNGLPPLTLGSHRWRRGHASHHTMRIFFYWWPVATERKRILWTTRIARAHLVAGRRWTRVTGYIWVALLGWCLYFCGWLSPK